MEKKLISVIIPAYNVEGYIVRCVESVCKQTYKNLEIIIINDGSTDSTGDLCESFLDNRIKVIHKQNEGISVARNEGLKVATGEYIAFVDSDDCIRSDMLEVLYNAILKYHADFAACGVEFYSESEPKSTYIGDSGKTINLNYQESVKYLCDKYFFNLWNKLYRRQVIEDIRFNPGEVCEEVAYMRKVFGRIQSTVYVEEPLYIYTVKRAGSSGIIYDERKLPALDEFELFINEVKAKGLKKLAMKLRGNQLGIIKSLYNETLDEDEANRKMLHKMFCHKVLKNCGICNYPLQYLVFIFIPQISRNKYQKKTKRNNV